SDRNSRRLKAAAFPPLASSCRCHAHYMAGSPAEAEPSAFRALLPMLMISSSTAALAPRGCLCPTGVERVHTRVSCLALFALPTCTESVRSATSYRIGRVAQVDAMSGLASRGYLVS